MAARFRIKKKQRVLNLERNVQDLSDRAEDLEKEAVELRKENELLREMVVLRGRLAVGEAAVHGSGSGSNFVQGGGSSSRSGPSGGGGTSSSSSNRGRRIDAGKKSGRKGD